MFTVVKASEKDISVISEIARQTWPDTFKNILTLKQIEYMLDMMYSEDSLTKQIRDKNHVFYLAKDESKFIGYVSYELNHPTSYKTKIHKIYILPSVQGKGVGKLLMNKVADIALQNNTTILSLNVNRDNKAINFYEKFGFTKIGREDIDIGNGFFMEDFIMEKKL
ncbi:MAG TPA: GNAT family N-acetyltransferase [Bacteroidia bacterium]|nr:GNAT family N-acetyltransferase [Bacteroidia bacterium]